MIPQQEPQPNQRDRERSCLFQDQEEARKQEGLDHHAGRRGGVRGAGGLEDRRADDQRNGVSGEITRDFN